jgi:hypothetical protein
MKLHPFAIWSLFAVTLFAFGFAVASGSLYVALVSLLFGIVLAFVMGIAWGRFRGGPTEHHPKVDRFVDDTRP